MKGDEVAERGRDKSDEDRLRREATKHPLACDLVGASLELHEQNTVVGRKEVRPEEAQGVVEAVPLPEADEQSRELIPECLRGGCGESEACRPSQARSRPAGELESQVGGEDGVPESRICASPGGRFGVP